MDFASNNQVSGECYTTYIRLAMQSLVCRCRSVEIVDDIDRPSGSKFVVSEPDEASLE